MTVPWVITSQYTVGVLAEDNINSHLYEIHVDRATQMDGSTKWAARWMGRCLGHRGQWDYEPIPSSRTDGWLNAYRFMTLEEALVAAKKAAPKLAVNGRVAEEGSVVTDTAACATPSAAGHDSTIRRWLLVSAESAESAEPGQPTKPVVETDIDKAHHHEAWRDRLAANPDTTATLRDRMAHAIHRVGCNCDHYYHFDEADAALAIIRAELLAIADEEDEGGVLGPLEYAGPLGDVYRHAADRIAPEVTP